MDELSLEPAERKEVPVAELTLDLATRLRPGVGSAFLDDEAVLLDPATGGSHLLDASAALVVRFLDGTSTLREIAFDIADVLEVEQERVESDVLTLVQTLGAHGLLEGVARDPYAANPHARPAEGVPVGADLGGWAGWEQLGAAAGSTVLVNWGTSCGFCTRIGASLAEMSPALAERGVRLVLVTTGSPEAFAAQVGDPATQALEVLHLEAVPEFFAGLGTPVAYRVDADRIVAEPLAIGADDVPRLLRSLLD